MISEGRVASRTQQLGSAVLDVFRKEVGISLRQQQILTFWLEGEAVGWFGQPRKPRYRFLSINGGEGGGQT